MTAVKWTLTPLTDAPVAPPCSNGEAGSRRSKVVHLIRHGQAVHNLVKDTEQYKLEKFLDCPLSAQGFVQVADLRKQVASSPPPGFPVDLVVVSPLLRTLQTAVGTFAPPHTSIPANLPSTKEPSKDCHPTLTVTVAEVTGAGQSAVTTTSPARILANELCRETLHVHVCDKRGDISERKPLFPTVDFSQLTADVDSLWRAAPRETRQEIFDRASEFAEWLLQQSAQSIAVVSHSGFLHAFATVGLPTSLRPENKLVYFENCRLRSYILADSE